MQICNSLKKAMQPDFKVDESYYVNSIFLLDRISPDIGDQSNFEIISDDLYQLESFLNELITENEDSFIEESKESQVCKIVHEKNESKLTDFLENYTDQIYPMCLDQYSCRLLQKELEVENINVTNKIYYEIVDHIAELMSDPIGNYLCQRLLDLIDENQRFIILDHCKNFLVDISNSPYGTRSVQKLIDVIDTDIESSIICEVFHDHVVAMIKDLNGNHVIRKCIQKLSKNQFIYDSISVNCIEVASNPYGCCIFKDCIEYASIEQKIQLINAVDLNVLTLIQDPFGNYVVQHILNLKIDSEIPTKITKRVAGQIYRLSKQKFSSNVIEKCLKEGDCNCVKRIMNEFLFNPVIKPKIYSRSFIEISAQNQILDLLRDDFGNYVIQTCLNESMIKTNKEYLLMIKLLLPIQRQIMNTYYGKKISHHLGIINKK